MRKPLATDIPRTLGALAEAGFDAVELENAFGKPGVESVDGLEWHIIEYEREAVPPRESLKATSSAS